MDFNTWWDVFSSKTIKYEDESNDEFIKRICEKSWNVSQHEFRNNSSHDYFTATVGRKSLSDKTSRPVIILHDVKYDNGEVFRDHVWIKACKRVSSMKGRIRFSAIEIPYLSIGGDKIGLRHIRNVQNVVIHTCDNFDMSEDEDLKSCNACYPNVGDNK